MSEKKRTLLVVTRKEHEAMAVTTPSGELIEIAVVRIRGSQVRVAVKCPEDFNIKRIDAMSPREEA